MTIMPHGELFRKAAAFVAEKRGEDPARPLEAILDEAGMRFNLVPLDGESLRRFFSDNDDGRARRDEQRE